MNFAPENAPRDPDIVFTPEYWGETYAPIHGRVPGFLLKRGERNAARNLMAELALQAIHGVVRGAEVVPGSVFCPNDEQLAATSPHNYPGTLLLYDYERMNPTSPESVKKFVERGEEEDELERQSFDSPPRTLMRNKMATDQYNTTRFGPVWIEYTNGYSDYLRKVGIAYIARLRRGGNLMLDLFFGSYNPTLDKESNGVKPTIYVIESNLPTGAVGDTHVRYDDKNEFGGAYRIRSLEILAGGQRAKASSKARFSLAPRTAHST